MSGSPIINLKNYKVIGIHKGANKNKTSNFGTFLREPIKQFYLKNKNSTNDGKDKQICGGDGSFKAKMASLQSRMAVQEKEKVLINSNSLSNEIIENKKSKEEKTNRK